MKYLQGLNEKTGKPNSLMQPKGLLFVEILSGSGLFNYLWCIGIGLDCVIKVRVRLCDSWMQTMKSTNTS